MQENLEMTITDETLTAQLLELEQLKSESNARKMRDFAEGELKKLGYSADFAAFVAADSEEATGARVTGFSQAFSAELERVLAQRMLQAQPKEGDTAYTRQARRTRGIRRI